MKLIVFSWCLVSTTVLSSEVQPNGYPVAAGGAAASSSQSTRTCTGSITNVPISTAAAQLLAASTTVSSRPNNPSMTGKCFKKNRKTTTTTTTTTLVITTALPAISPAFSPPPPQIHQEPSHQQSGPPPAPVVKKQESLQEEPIQQISAPPPPPSQAQQGQQPAGQQQGPKPKVIPGIITIPSDKQSTIDESLKYAVSNIQLPEFKSHQETCLNAHNVYRKVMGKPLLVWSDLAEREAQQWANTLATTRAFEHSKKQGFGENLYRVRGASPSCNAAVLNWMNEYSLYNETTKIGDGDFEGYGHFTQLMWDSTTSVGCAQAVNGRDVTWVCEYSPPGNVQGMIMEKKLAD